MSDQARNSHYPRVLGLAIRSAACLALAVCTTSAYASFTGLTDQLVNSLTVGGGPKDVYRVYANFSDANDYLVSVFGASGNALTIQSRNSTDTAAGSNFFNPGGTGGNQAPDVAGQPGNVWGTFATIGIYDSIQGSGPDPDFDQTGLNASFPNFISGSSISNTNISWFGSINFSQTPSAVEQGRAGYTGDGDMLLRVMIMQLTVVAGGNVKGTVNLSGINNTALAGGDSFTATQQTFSSVVPAPGALGLLGLAGLFGRGARRRRA